MWLFVKQISILSIINRFLGLHPSKTGLFGQFFLFENRPSATGQGRRILPPNSGELKSLGSVAVSANANVSLIPGAKNRAKYDITYCKNRIFREKRLAPKSNAKSTSLFIQTTGHWGFERCVDREGRLLRPKAEEALKAVLDGLDLWASWLSVRALLFV